MDRPANTLGEAVRRRTRPLCSALVLAGWLMSLRVDAHGINGLSVAVVADDVPLFVYLLRRDRATRGRDPAPRPTERVARYPLSFCVLPTVVAEVAAPRCALERAAARLAAVIFPFLTRHFESLRLRPLIHRAPDAAHQSAAPPRKCARSASPLAALGCGAPAGPFVVAAYRPNSASESQSYRPRRASSQRTLLRRAPPIGTPLGVRRKKAARLAPFFTRDLASLLRYCPGGRTDSLRRRRPYCRPHSYRFPVSAGCRRGRDPAPRPTERVARFSLFPFPFVFPSIVVGWPHPDAPSKPRCRIQLRPSRATSSRQHSRYYMALRNLFSDKYRSVVIEGYISRRRIHERASEIWLVHVPSDR
jgi:hypothetical protein